MTLRPLIAALLAMPLALSAQAPHLIPVPREITAKPDQPLPNGVQILCTGCDLQDQFAADDLRQTLAARGLAVDNPNGLHILLQRRADATFTDAMKPEGYTIASSPSALALTGATAESVFYAAQTAKQMIEQSDPTHFVLHAADIRDWPAMKYRGLHDDLSRGPIPTLAFQKHLIQTLAAYKVNIYSPYFEETQQYASNPLPAPPGGSLSASDARELAAFAARYHIMIVPEQEAFGHLRHMLLWEQYAPLAETPHGAVLAPGQPGSLTVISQMFTELAHLYPSPFLHIGGDETVDLGVGQTKTDVDTRGLGPVYLDFLQQIVTTLQPLNRKILFWGDVAENSPDLLKAMPQAFKDQTIAVAWGYSPKPKGFDKDLKPFVDAGIETWVSPSINNYRQVFPNQQLALDDIQQFTRDGQRLGATGQLNTLWNDDGESLADMNWYGILFGATAAWQPGESSIPQFQQTYAQVFHGDRTGLLNQAEIELTTAMTLLHDAKILGATEGTDGLFWIDPWTRDGAIMATKLQPVASAVRLHAESAITLIAQARAASPASTLSSRPEQSEVERSQHLPLSAPATNLSSRPDLAPNLSSRPDLTPNLSSRPERSAVERPASPEAAQTSFDPANAFPSNPTSLREPNAIDAMEFGARRIDFLCLKFQLADEMTQGYIRAQTASLSTDKKIRNTVYRELSDINGVNGRIQDIASGYSQLRDLYAQTWLRTNRPFALRRVLEHYDESIALWNTRMDKVRIAQRQFADTHTLPPAADAGIGIPTPTAPPTTEPPAPPTSPTPHHAQAATTRKKTKSTAKNRHK